MHRYPTRRRTHDGTFQQRGIGYHPWTVGRILRRQPRSGRRFYSLPERSKEDCQRYAAANSLETELCTLRHTSALKSMPQRIILSQSASESPCKSSLPILFFISPYTTPALKLSPAPIVLTVSMEQCRTFSQNYVCTDEYPCRHPYR